TGYSFNLDGSTLYQSIAAIFIAQLYGIDLSLWQEIVLVLTLMATLRSLVNNTKKLSTIRVENITEIMGFVKNETGERAGPSRLL
ncbi:cation:dicarboxylase symporter family transporter, partial [Enterobacter hormaechei]|uniref:cation:dicarboxylate symporter family transporter n=1 Tax=Enterobacter hormaechei TaxID=158836 RepID=UPI0025A1560E